MTTLNIEMDHLDQIAADAFPGYLVRKDLVQRYARQYPVPTYVVEFLLGRYCASTDPDEIQEGLGIVERQLEGRTVRSGDEELFKSKAREQGSVRLIDIVHARLDAKNDRYVAELPSPCAYRFDLHRDMFPFLVRRDDVVMRDVTRERGRYQPSAGEFCGH